MIKKPLIRAGTYKHFKGGMYKVISIAKHSETHEDMIVYRSLKDEDQLWVRPLAMFVEKVKIPARTGTGGEGKMVQRFEFIK